MLALNGMRGWQQVHLWKTPKVKKPLELPEAGDATLEASDPGTDYWSPH